MRSSPANGFSRPPEKKKVTWAYFSVSAIRSCVRPCRGQIFAQRVVQTLRPIGDVGDGQALFVFGQGHECGQRRYAPALEAVEIGIDKGMAQLARAVGPEIHEYHRIAVAHGTGCRRSRSAARTRRSRRARTPHQVRPAALSALNCAWPSTIACQARCTRSQRLSRSIAK